MVISETPSFNMDHKDWTYSNSYQLDRSTSCGMFVLMFGEKILEAKSPAILRQCHVQDFRWHIREKILSHVDSSHQHAPCQYSTYCMARGRFHETPHNLRIIADEIVHWLLKAPRACWLHG